MKHNKNMKDILRLPIVFTEDGVRKTETLEEFFSTRPIFYVNRYPKRKFMRLITACSNDTDLTDGLETPRHLAVAFCTALYWKFIKPVAKYILKTEKR